MHLHPFLLAYTCGRLEGSHKQVTQIFKPRSVQCLSLIPEPRIRLHLEFDLSSSPLTRFSFATIVPCRSSAMVPCASVCGLSMTLYAVVGHRLCFCAVVSRRTIVVCPQAGHSLSSTLHCASVASASCSPTPQWCFHTPQWPILRFSRIVAFFHHFFFSILRLASTLVLS